MSRSTIPTILAALAALALSACVIAPSAPVSTPDGLEKRTNAKVDSVYAAPGVSLARYRRVMLDAADVAFKPDWESRNPQITAKEVADIREVAARLFRAAFTGELSKGGYDIATAPAPDVLRVSATVVDLDFVPAGVNAGAIGKGVLVSAADISLLADLRDSQSGAILARVADRKRGRNYGNLEVASQENSSKEAVQAFAAWAGLLREALDAARGQ